jgi:hypothetical protein
MRQYQYLGKQKKLQINLQQINVVSIVTVSTHQPQQQSQQPLADKKHRPVPKSILVFSSRETNATALTRVATSTSPSPPPNSRSINYITVQQITTTIYNGQTLLPGNWRSTHFQ